MNNFLAHILVVDDDEGIRLLVKRYLNENNYLITTADSAEDASEKVKVIIGSETAAEGLDFKYIREIHILEPWYNINRIEYAILFCRFYQVGLATRDLHQFEPCVFGHRGLAHNLLPNFLQLPLTKIQEIHGP